LVIDQDVADWKKELEESLKKKIQEKDGILKIIRTKNIGLHSLKTSNSDVDNAMANVDRDISKLKEDLGGLLSVTALQFQV
jgi:hypothetical protein